MTKRGCTIVALAPFVIIALIVVLYMIIAATNDFSAARVEKDILSLPLPENTTVVESLNECGKLVGEGNGMQFFGAALLRSDLSLEELEAYYAPFRPDEWHYIVEPQEGKEIEAVEHPVIRFKTNVDSDGYYILYSWGDSHNPLRYLDLRGN